MRVLLLPGLDGTGRLFDRLLTAANGSGMELQVVRYPVEQVRGYAGLLPLVHPHLPDAPFVLLAESFSGPLALRLAAERPPGLRALVLAATFHRRPVGRTLARVRVLARPLLFVAPPSALVIRALLAGMDADDALVAEIRDAIASVSPAVLAARVRTVLDEDATDALARCPVPILYMHATQDALLRRGIVEEMRVVRPDMEVVSIDAPHLVLQRAPEAALAAVATFVHRQRDA